MVVFHTERAAPTLNHTADSFFQRIYQLIFPDLLEPHGIVGASIAGTYHHASHPPLKHGHYLRRRKMIYILLYFR